MTTTDTPSRFVQITAAGGDNDGDLYALDEAGHVWIFSNEEVAWKMIPWKRGGMSL